MRVVDVLKVHVFLDVICRSGYFVLYSISLHFLLARLKLAGGGLNVSVRSWHAAKGSETTFRPLFENLGHIRPLNEDLLLQKYCLGIKSRGSTLFGLFKLRLRVLHESVLRLSLFSIQYSQNAIYHQLLLHLCYFFLSYFELAVDLSLASLQIS